MVALGRGRQVAGARCGGGWIVLPRLSSSSEHHGRFLAIRRNRPWSVKENVRPSGLRSYESQEKGDLFLLFQAGFQT